jgi:hypothetical protein
MLQHDKQWHRARASYDKPTLQLADQSWRQLVPAGITEEQVEGDRLVRRYTSTLAMACAAPVGHCAQRSIPSVLVAVNEQYEHVEYRCPAHKQGPLAGHATGGQQAFVAVLCTSYDAGVTWKRRVVHTSTEPLQAHVAVSDAGAWACIVLFTRHSGTALRVALMRPAPTQHPASNAATVASSASASSLGPGATDSRGGVYRAAGAEHALEDGRMDLIVRSDHSAHPLRVGVIRDNGSGLVASEADVWAFPAASSPDTTFTPGVASAPSFLHPGAVTPGPATPGPVTQGPTTPGTRAASRVVPASSFHAVEGRQEEIAAVATNAAGDVVVCETRGVRVFVAASGEWMPLCTRAAGCTAVAINEEWCVAASCDAVYMNDTPGSYASLDREDVCMGPLPLLPELYWEKQQLQQQPQPQSRPHQEQCMYGKTPTTVSVAVTKQHWVVANDAGALWHAVQLPVAGGGSCRPKAWTLLSNPGLAWSTVSISPPISSATPVCYALSDAGTVYSNLSTFTTCLPRHSWDGGSLETGWSRDSAGGGESSFSILLHPSPPPFIASALPAAFSRGGP